MNISDHPRTPRTCGDCDSRLAGSFCSLIDSDFSQLQAVKACQEYPRGTSLFMEGQAAHGVYIICTGQVKLSTYSEEGKAIILGIAGPGEILGLSANILGRPHETTAHASQACRVGFVKRTAFLNFIQTNHRASLNALEQLGKNYIRAHQQVCSLGLSMSAADKLARLMIQWSDSSSNGGPVRISPVHTHGEIGEMIGTSRETVTRLLKAFRDRGLIEISKHELCIPDLKRLYASIGTRYRNGNGNGNANGNGNRNGNGNGNRNGNGNSTGNGHV